MTDRLTLGSTPADMTVWLVADAPFAASVTADAEFPAAPELVFDVGGTLASTLSGDSLTAAWLLTAEQVDALTTAGPSRVTLRDPATHHAYAAGRVYTRVIVGSGAPSSVPSTGALTVDTLDGNLTLTYATSEVDPAEIEAAVEDYLTANPPASAVESVNGETGVVVLDAADVGADPAGTAATAVAGVTVASIGAATAAQGAKADTAVQPADLTPYATDADLSGHASDTTAVHGIADTSALVLTTDSRLSDARTPTAHKASHATGGGDALTPADIGAATSGHTHAAPDLSGYVPTSRTVNGKALSANVTLNAADVGASTFSGAYGDLSGKPTLGTAAATAATDYATAAQGAKADSALQVATAQPINAQTGTTYTLQASDAGKLVTLNNTGAITLNAPGSVFTAGQQVDVIVLNTGMATVVGTSGATVNGTPSLVSRARYSAFTVKWLSATSAIVIGDLA